MKTTPLLSNESELKPRSLDVGGFVFGEYSFPSKDPAAAEKMALQIASGQTLGFIPEDVAAYEDYLASITEIKPTSDSRYRATIAFPATLFGTDMAGLLTVVFGKISFAPGLRLEALRGDDVYLNRIRGATWGLSGIRDKLSAPSDRPLLMAILKPGLGPDDRLLAGQFSELVHAGVDLVKDDEVRIDLTLDDARARLAKVLDASGGKGIYVMALNGPAFELKSRAIQLQAEGAQAFLVCPFTYGLSVLQSLCEDPDIGLPIFAHPAFTGIMSTGSNGINPSVSLGTLMRWCGADGVLYPSPYGSIALPTAEALGIHNSLTRKEAHLKVVTSVPSAGILPEFVSQIKADFGTDVVVNAGTGMAKSGNTVSAGAQVFVAEIAKHYEGKA